MKKYEKEFVDGAVYRLLYQEKWFGRNRGTDGKWKSCSHCGFVDPVDPDKHKPWCPANIFMSICMLDQDNRKPVNSLKDYPLVIPVVRAILDDLVTNPLNRTRGTIPLSADAVPVCMYCGTHESYNHKRGCPVGMIVKWVNTAINEAELRVSDQEKKKKNNRQLVLDVLEDGEHKSLPEIARASCLSEGAVAVLLRNLVTRGKVAASRERVWRYKLKDTPTAAPAHKPTPKKKKPLPNKDKVFRVMENHPAGLTVVQIAGYAGVPKRGVRRALVQLKEEGQVYYARAGRVNVWRTMMGALPSR